MNEEIGMKDLWIMVSKTLENFWETIVLNHGIKNLWNLFMVLKKCMVLIQCEYACSIKFGCYSALWYRKPYGKSETFLGQQKWDLGGNGLAYSFWFLQGQARQFNTQAQLFFILIVAIFHVIHVLFIRCKTLWILADNGIKL